MGKPRVSMCQDGASLGVFDTMEPVTIRHGSWLASSPALRCMYFRSDIILPLCLPWQLANLAISSDI